MSQTYVKQVTLTEFLLARIAEDEFEAAETKGRAGIEFDGAVQWAYQAALRASDQHWHREQASRHIARWDPARVLAECEAKRRIVERHHAAGRSGLCDECHAQVWPCPTLRALALPYADHPEFREEWRP